MKVRRSDPSNPLSQSCEPKACTGRCGVVSLDACGVAVNCGGCSGGLVCVNGTCKVADAGASTAAPTPERARRSPAIPTRAPRSAGTVTDGCGHTMACACPIGQTCTGGVCGPLPPECTPDGGAPSCGTVANACGSGSIACPAKCAGATQCVRGACTACTPPTCDGRTCGSVSNGCGAAVTCGSCGSETCYDGGCCEPQTCAAALDAGAVSGCAPVDLGCGVKTACIKCASRGDLFERHMRVVHAEDVLRLRKRGLWTRQRMRRHAQLLRGRHVLHRWDLLRRGRGRVWRLVLRPPTVIPANRRGPR